MACVSHHVDLDVREASVVLMHDIWRDYGIFRAMRDERRCVNRTGRLPGFLASMTCSGAPPPPTTLSVFICALHSHIAEAGDTPKQATRGSRQLASTLAAV